MATSLATLSLGGVGGFYPWLIHTGNGNLAAGFQLETGGGVETPLFLDESGIGVRNAGGFVGKIRYEGDAHGVVTLRKDPDVALLAANQANSTTTGVALTSFSIPLAADTKYRLHGWFICQHNNAARSVQIALTGPAGSLSIMHVEFRHMGVNTLGTGGNENLRRVIAFADYYAPTNCPLADTPYLVHVEGIIITNGTPPASALGVEFKSSAATHNAQILAGSRLQLTEY